jgi:hypothetical protein
VLSRRRQAEVLQRRVRGGAGEGVVEGAQGEGDAGRLASLVGGAEDVGVYVGGLAVAVFRATELQSVHALTLFCLSANHRGPALCTLPSSLCAATAHLVPAAPAARLCTADFHRKLFTMASCASLGPCCGPSPADTAPPTRRRHAWTPSRRHWTRTFPSRRPRRG